MVITEFSGGYGGNGLAKRTDASLLAIATGTVTAPLAIKDSLPPAAVGAPNVGAYGKTKEIVLVPATNVKGEKMNAGKGGVGGVCPLCEKPLEVYCTKEAYCNYCHAGIRVCLSSLLFRISLLIYISYLKILSFQSAHSLQTDFDLQEEKWVRFQRSPVKVEQNQVLQWQQIAPRCEASLHGDAEKTAINSTASRCLDW